VAIIVVGGSNRGVGKTALVCSVIAALPEYRWAAVKISSHDHPHAVSRGPIPAAGGLAGDRSASRQSSILHFFDRNSSDKPVQPETAPSGSFVWEETTSGDNTDTARYLAAGAARAFLVCVPGGDLPPVLDQLWPRFGRGTNIIFESNSIVHQVRPDACLLIHAVAERSLPLPERKPSFLAAVGQADAMISRARSNKVILDAFCLTDSEPENSAPPSPKPIFQLASLERISPELSAWLRLKIDRSSGS
jgi:hypothetical protein